MEHVADALTQLASLQPGVIPDDHAIRAAVHLVGYDIAFRVGPDAYTGDHTVPDEVTITHIRTMVERAGLFFSGYGPITEDGFTPVNPLSMTPLVDSGDGDFLTADTLWDFKVSVNPPTAIHTLQLLMYLLMGQRSGQEQYGHLTHLGIYNPRLNTVYRVALVEIPSEVVSAVSHDVIGYALAQMPADKTPPWRTLRRRLCREDSLRLSELGAVRSEQSLHQRPSGQAAVITFSDCTDSSLGSRRSNVGPSR